MATETSDDALMMLALEAAPAARTRSAPNPWVGAAIHTASDEIVTGATEPPGSRHAEVVALDAAGAGAAGAAGATLATTLEPCSHRGRTGPCTEAIIGAGVARVLVAIEDPDPEVAGRGIARLREAGLAVDVGATTGSPGSDGVTAATITAVTEYLAPYLHHRRTGRPYVVLKLAASIDGRTAAPDGSSRWITGEEARTDVHRVRSESQAILVGAGTVRADDPHLTTRLVDGPDPRRVVLGTAPPDARVRPCLEWSGDIAELLGRLGADGVVQLLVEGGSTVAAEFHRRRLVDRYVVYLAPAIFGGDDAVPLFRGPSAPTIDDVLRGRFAAVRQLGADIRLDVEPLIE